MYFFLHKCAFILLRNCDIFRLDTVTCSSETTQGVTSLTTSGIIRVKGQCEHI